MSDAQEKDTGAVSSTEEVKSDKTEQKSGTAGAKKSGYGAFFTLVAIIVAVIAVIVIIATGGKKIDLNKYATIKVSGYNTIGTAQLEFDKEKFEKDFGDKLKIKKGSDQQELMKMLYGSASKLFVEAYVSGSFDKNKQLSNGDKIVYTWNVDADKIKEVFGYKVVCKDIKMTVKDLEEIATFDPFEGVEVEFSGTAPNGTATIKNNSTSKYASKLKFKLDKSSGLSNGDTVTVEVNDGNSQNPTQYFINLCEAVPSATEKQFTVSGLSAYISSASQIPEDNMNTMKKQAEDVISAYVAKNWSEESNMDSCKYVGNYFLSSKSGNGGEQNIIYLVYKIQATIYSEKREINDTFEFYTSVRFSNMLMLADGKFSMDVSKYVLASDTFTKTYGSGFFNTYNYYVKGYELLDTLFNRNIATVVDRYNYEDNIAE